MIYKYARESVYGQYNIPIEVRQHPYWFDDAAETMRDLGRQMRKEQLASQKVVRPLKVGLLPEPRLK